MFISPIRYKLKKKLQLIYNCQKKANFSISKFNIRCDITHPNIHIDVVSTKYEVMIIA